MKVGFTGTRKGMTENQKEQFAVFLCETKPSEFHHGDCIGADSEAHDIVRLFFPQCRIVVYPTFGRYRAYKKGDLILEPKQPLERNYSIVGAAEIMIATPKEESEVIRSGTWATVRYARKALIPVTIIVP